MEIYSILQLKTAVECYYYKGEQVAAALLQPERTDLFLISASPMGIHQCLSFPNKLVIESLKKLRIQALH